MAGRPGVRRLEGLGSTGKAGLSMYYVAQFLREQSHTVVDSRSAVDRESTGGYGSSVDRESTEHE
jgi:hypothetical protein